MSCIFSPPLDRLQPLPPTQSWPEAQHQFDEESVWAVRAALHTRRPLLVRGEPGIGKSQLARAAAEVLGWPFLYHVVHARCEPTDLLYTYDAVERLAQAQVLGAARHGKGWRALLDPDRFVRPGVLWWAFHWEDARRQARTSCRKDGCGPGAKACCPGCGEPERPAGWEPGPGKGCVVLIDEIDKAEAEVPNALLESLGNNGFQVPLVGRAVSAHPRPGAEEPARQAPLVVVTTNEERELPAAFLRRCLVLQMDLGKTEADQRKFLEQRARVYHSEAQVSSELLEAAITRLLKDRTAPGNEGPGRPGAAELLDVLQVLSDLQKLGPEKQREALDQVRSFFFSKNPAEERP
jgi:MoxR-like ATPase